MIARQPTIEVIVGVFRIESNGLVQVGQGIAVSFLQQIGIGTSRIRRRIMLIDRNRSTEILHSRQRISLFDPQLSPNHVTRHVAGKFSYVVGQMRFGL